MKVLIAIVLLAFTSSVWADVMKVKVKTDRDHYFVSYDSDHGKRHRHDDSRSHRYDRYHDREHDRHHGKHYRKHHRKHHHKSQRRHPVFGVYYSPGWWDYHYFGYSGDRRHDKCHDMRHRHR